MNNHKSHLLQNSQSYFVLKICFIEELLIYNVVSISVVQPSDAATPTHTHTHTHIYTLFHISHYGLSQGTEYSSLCYTIGPCCLSTLYKIVASANSELPVHPSPIPLFLVNHSLFKGVILTHANNLTVL